MTIARKRIDRLAKRDDAAPQEVVTVPDDDATSAEERLREAAQTTFDRIKAARLARGEKDVKQTD